MPTATVAPTATATSTPGRATTPTHVPTSVPTTVPSSGVSGILVHDPNSGMTGCSEDRSDLTVISDNTIDSAAFLRFEVPNVRRWSIGIRYHDTVEAGSDSATVIWSEGHGDVFAGHWSRENGKDIHNPLSQRIGRNSLRTESGPTNELSFRSTPSGSSLRLNDDTVIEVPASQLIRRSGWSRLCVGFYQSEDEPYSIRYSDLRTRFVRNGVSGSLTHDGNYDRYVGCPTHTLDVAHITRYATDSWLVLDFIVPSVDEWSFGIIYHGVAGRDSRTYVYSFGILRYAAHTIYHDGEFIDEPRRYISSAGPKVRLEFETTSRGSSMYLNGSKVFDVSSGNLNRRTGTVDLCTGITGGEQEPYSIRFSDLWAWAE